MGIRGSIGGMDHIGGTGPHYKDGTLIKQPGDGIIRPPGSENSWPFV